MADYWDAFPPLVAPAAPAAPAAPTVTAANPWDAYERVTPVAAPPAAGTNNPWDAYERVTPLPAPEPATVYDLAAKQQQLRDLARVGSTEASFGLAPRGAAALATLMGNQPSYNDALAAELKKDEEASNRLGPATAMAAGLVGGMATGGPLLKMVKPAVGVVKRIGQAALEGGVLGGMQSAGQTYTGKPEDYINNAASGAELGGVFGFGGGAAGATVGGARRGVDYLLNRPLNNVSAAVQADLPGLQRVLNTPGAMLPDMGPSMLGVAQGSVLGTGGPGRSALKAATEARNAGTDQRIAQAINQNLGPTTIPSVEAAGVGARMGEQSPLAVEYETAFNRSHPVDTSEIARTLSQRAMDERGATQAALKQTRGMLDITGAPGYLDPDPRVLQKVRTEVRGMRDAQNVPPRTRAVLNDAYDQISQEMHNRIPGIREADAQYAELAAQRQALQPRETGASIFDTGRNTGMRPDEFAAEMAAAAEPKGSTIALGPSGEAFRMRQGARAELDRIVGTNRNDLAKLNNVLGQPQDWNSQKLATAFGPQRAQAVRDVLERETGFRDTYQKLFGGPETAQRLAAKEMSDPVKLITPSTSLTGLALSGAKRLAQNVIDSRTASARDRIALQMAEQDPQRMQAIVQEWLAVPKQRAAVANAVRDRIARGIVNSGVAGRTAIATPQMQ
jgi:hypothetical protein